MPCYDVSYGVGMALEIVCFYLLGTPARVLLAAVGGGLLSGVVGWRRVAGRAHAAWRHVASRSGERGGGAYRAPLRTTGIARTPLLVPATVLVSRALYPLHATCLFVLAMELRHAHVAVALPAFCLAAVGLYAAAGSRALTLQSGVDPGATRRRAMVSAGLVLLVHGMALAALLPLLTGSFDTLTFEVLGLKRTVSVMSLRELSDHPPLFGSLQGHPFWTWQAIYVGAAVYAAGSVVHAALMLALARASRGLSRAPDEGDLPRSEEQATLPVRVRVAVIAAALGIFGMAGVAYRWSAALVLGQRFGTASEIYSDLDEVCALPPLPRDATDLCGDHKIDLMWESAFVTFRTTDPAGYGERLLASGYEPSNAVTSDLDDGPPPADAATRPRGHYRFSRGWHHEPPEASPFLACTVTVDRGTGRVHLSMQAGD